MYLLVLFIMMFFGWIFWCKIFLWWIVFKLLVICFIIFCIWEMFGVGLLINYCVRVCFLMYWNILYCCVGVVLWGGFLIMWGLVICFVSYFLRLNNVICFLFWVSLVVKVFMINFFCVFVFLVKYKVLCVDWYSNFFIR